MIFKLSINKDMPNEEQNGNDAQHISLNSTGGN
jgi:hypothetical protein